ncbi:MAG: SEC-C metal-binding domain-containing protein [Kiritimatiellia bacterium]|nr:SEC-C metal-binding domain-containing protein [Kiritimatiellia bacterium]
MITGRNDPCPCGSGKKYKKCCMGKEGLAVPLNATPRPHMPVDDFDDLDPARADVASSEYWEKMSKRLPRDMRREFGPMIAQAKQYVAMESRRELVESAVEVMAAHRAEYDKLRKNTSDLLRRAEKLFGEEPFADMCFCAADVQRAFEAVGYTSPGRMDKRFTEIVDKAVRFLLNTKQREELAQRLLLTLPEYVNAGRYLDGWIIRHSVDLTVELPEGMVGPFLLVMFMHGLKEWEDLRDREQNAMLAEIGLSPEQIRQMGYEGLEVWMRDMRGKPDKTAAMEKFLAKHPELNAMTQAQCRAAEDAALKLLQRDDAQGLLLSPSEVYPWLEILENRFRATPEGIASLSQSRPPDESIAKAFVNLVYDVAFEMAAAVFTPARLEQLKAQLHELRRALTAADDHDALTGMHGALMAAQATTAPEDSHFLVTVCCMSLRSAMEAMGPAR